MKNIKGWDTFIVNENNEMQQFEEKKRKIKDSLKSSSLLPEFIETDGDPAEVLEIMNNIEDPIEIGVQYKLVMERWPALALTQTAIEKKKIEPYKTIVAIAMRVREIFLK